MNRILKPIVLKTSKDVLIRAMSTSGLTTVKFSAGIKKITMTDTKTRNSLSTSMLKELTKHVTADWDNQDLRVIVLEGQGPVFSSGHNLKEMCFNNNDNLNLADIFKQASKLMMSIIDCPVPVIASVNGVAAAAGCQLVAQCDIVVASTKSKFSTPGASFGVFCSTPGIPIARTVSMKTGLYMVLSGFPLDATEAKTAGLVSVVCEESELGSTVDNICNAIISKSRHTIARGKQFYHKQVQVDIKTAYKMGEEEMCSRISEHDGQEGIRSFIEKRKPNWKHSS